MSDLIRLLDSYPPSWAVVTLVLGGIGYIIYIFVKRYGGQVVDLLRDRQRYEASKPPPNDVAYRDAILQERGELLRVLLDQQRTDQKQIEQFLSVLIDQQEVMRSLLTRLERRDETDRRLVHMMGKVANLLDSVWFTNTVILGASGGNITSLIEQAQEKIRQARQADT